MKNIKYKKLAFFMLNFIIKYQVSVNLRGNVRFYTEADVKV